MGQPFEYLLMVCHWHGAELNAGGSGVPSVSFIYGSFLSNFFVLVHHLLHSSDGITPI